MSTGGCLYLSEGLEFDASSSSQSLLCGTYLGSEMQLVIQARRAGIVLPLVVPPIRESLASTTPARAPPVKQVSPFCYKHVGTQFVLHSWYPTGLRA